MRPCSNLAGVYLVTWSFEDLAIDSIIIRQFPFELHQGVKIGVFGVTAVFVLVAGIAINLIEDELVILG